MKTRVDCIQCYDNIRPDTFPVTHSCFFSCVQVFHIVCDFFGTASYFNNFKSRQTSAVHVQTVFLGVNHKAAALKKHLVTPSTKTNVCPPSSQVAHISAESFFSTKAYSWSGGIATARGEKESLGQHPAVTVKQLNLSSWPQTFFTQTQHRKADKGNATGAGPHISPTVNTAVKALRPFQPTFSALLVNCR